VRLAKEKLYIKIQYKSADYYVGMMYINTR